MKEIPFDRNNEEMVLTILRTSLGDRKCFFEDLQYVLSQRLGNKEYLKLMAEAIYNYSYRCNDKAWFTGILKPTIKKEKRL